MRMNYYSNFLFGSSFYGHIQQKQIVLEAINQNERNESKKKFCKSHSFANLGVEFLCLEIYFACKKQIKLNHD